MQFENILNLNGKNLTGNELCDSPCHDEIIMVRTIEANKDAIKSHPRFLFPKITMDDVKFIYREFCATQLHNGVENLSISTMREAINLCFLF